jgi:tRNA (guanine37-N1)-methyltransferase
VEYQCIIVPKTRAENIRKKLVNNHQLLKDVKIKRDEKNVYFPIKKPVKIRGCTLGKYQFETIKKKSYIELLRDKNITIESLSMDFIGDIALLRLDDAKYITEIAEAILESNTHVKTVFIDHGVKDDYRVRDIEFILGDNKTETTHTEFGVSIKVDISKTYFSPRLAAERLRIAQQIKKGEYVIDMFAGVAPFGLIIAKYSHPKKIFSIDKNHHAVQYAQKNVILNKKENLFEIIEGDAKKIIKTLPHVHHIIMNLPHKSYGYLPAAIKKAKLLHYYEILDRKGVEERLDNIKQLGEKNGYKIGVSNTRIVGSYSPSKIRFGVELQIKKL